ncbi:hypothetical protein IWT140_01935 [Secundilactobacillus pentosiphilus]|uniref:Zinc-ribbon domain-containing protein n=1 Tax=Secundilactobacillus pentosiphilus TaxID=1714682 RepID=A0A1Z5IRA7_9LACO|nr:zinc ribbon domain-containing protein [Secundilactobacillus pentosiphilus]GAX04297.1 hypothetical protein IWT140_01935 [Secundilactobacillus pentosiphilus]
MSETAGPSFCPNCGAKLKPGAKFCTSCGYDLTQFNARSQQQPTQGAGQRQSNQQHVSQPNLKVEAAKNYSTNYFSWLWDSIKHPSQTDLSVNQFFGATSFVISALLIGLISMVGLYRIIDAISSFESDLGSLFSEVDGTSSSDTAASVSQPSGSGFSLFLKIFIIALIFTAMFVLIGWLVRRYMIGDEKETYLGFATRLAGYTNFSLIFLALALVFVALLNALAGGALLFIFLSLSVTTFSIGYSYTILEFKQTRGMDKIYALLIALIADSFLTMILMSIVGASIL